MKNKSGQIVGSLSSSYSGGNWFNQRSKTLKGLVLTSATPSKLSRPSSKVRKHLPPKELFFFSNES